MILFTYITACKVSTLPFDEGLQIKYFGPEAESTYFLSTSYEAKYELYEFMKKPYVHLGWPGIIWNA